MPLPIIFLVAALSSYSPTVDTPPPMYDVEILQRTDHDPPGRSRSYKTRKRRKKAAATTRARGSRSVRHYRMRNHKLRPIKYRFRKRPRQIHGGRYGG